MFGRRSAKNSKEGDPRSLRVEHFASVLGHNKHPRLYVFTSRARATSKRLVRLVSSVTPIVDLTDWPPSLQTF